MEVIRILSTGSRLVLATGARFGRKASRARRKGVKRARKRIRRNRSRLLRQLRSRIGTTLNTLPEQPQRETLQERPTLPTLTEEVSEPLPALFTLPEEGLQTDEVGATQVDALNMLRIPDELLRRGNLDLVNWLFAEDYLMHDLESGREFRGIEGYKEYATLLRRALADILVTVHHQEVRGDRVVTQYTVRGTQTGRLLGRDASGVAVAVGGRLVTRFAAGMIAEEWNSYDSAGLRRQLETGGATRSPTRVAPARADVGR